MKNFQKLRMVDPDTLSDKQEQKQSQLESFLFRECLESGTHLAFSNLYYFISEYYGNYIRYCELKDKQYIYMWNNETTLYCKTTTINVYTSMMDVLHKYFEQKLQQACSVYAKVDIKKSKKEMSQENEELSKIRSSYQKAMKKIGTCSFMREVSHKYIMSEQNNSFLKKLDSNGYVINFKNGILDVTEDYFCPKEDDMTITENSPIEDFMGGRSIDHYFRKRTPYDYYTICLDYDYKCKYDNQIYQELKTVISNTCNNNEIDIKLIKSYLGYSMLGTNKEQISLWLIGHTASNGKSTLITMFMDMFDIYCKEINNRTFEQNFSNPHKQFADAQKKRFIFLEEISKKKIDVETFNRVVGNRTFGGNEVLFGTTEDIPITFTFAFTSNNSPNFNDNNGTSRRGMIVEMTNQFLDKEKYDTLDNKKGYYVKDKELLEKMQRDDYKLALFHILYPYTLQYYNDKCIPKIYKEKAIKLWENIYKDNDPMKEFITKYFEITKNVDDRVPKELFLRDYAIYSGLRNISFGTVLNHIKRLKIPYDRQKRATSDKDKDKSINKKGEGNKGVLLGIKRNDKLIKFVKDIDDTNIIQKKIPSDNEIIKNEDVAGSISFEEQITNTAQTDITLGFDSFDD